MNPIFNFLETYWFNILSAITVPVAYIFGGKAKQKIELKQSNADAVATMQSVYDAFLQDYKETY